MKKIKVFRLNVNFQNYTCLERRSVLWHHGDLLDKCVFTDHQVSHCLLKSWLHKQENRVCRKIPSSGTWAIRSQFFLCQCWLLARTCHLHLLGEGRQHTKGNAERRMNMILFWLIWKHSLHQNVAKQVISGNMASNGHLDIRPRSQAIIFLRWEPILNIQACRIFTMTRKLILI